MATVTFLFTDIEGSTRLWDAHGEAMDVALRRHDALIEGVVAEHGGRIFKHTGDGTLSAFPSTAEAVAAAAEAQRVLSDEDFGEVGSLNVRMAIHAGEAAERDGDFFGPALNRAARIMDAARGGQVLLSASATAIVRSALPKDANLQDLGEHRLKDLGEPEQIHQLVAPGLGSDFGPLRSLELRPNNLPVQLTSFVGRERELAEVVELLSQNRIVTLTGVGGVGKTRLATQAAAESVDRFPEGVWLVELAPLSEGGLVLPAIAAAAGVTEEPTRPLMETVVRELDGSRVLLVIDNCEHLIDEVAKVADELLRGCADLRILATSREGLAVGGERLWRCPSMSAGSDAIDLFLERAELYGGVDVGDAATRQAVERICERLDGIPLAIELATARLKVFTAEQLASRLDDRFRLLTGGSRTAMPRQRTLQAAMDWSHDLLAEHERVLLRRLGVFHGGFTLESAERVCADDAVPDFEVLDLVTHLVDASLITFDSHEEQPRYRLLETVRQYAMDRLFDAQEADEFRRRHAVEFEVMMQDADAGLLSPESDRWAALCRSEEDNVRAALTWALEGGDPGLALRLAAGFGRYWFNAGRIVEGRERLAQVLRVEHGDSTHLAEANSWLAHFLYLEGKGAEARPYADRSIEVAARVDDPHVLLRSRMVKANLVTDQGKIADAVAEYVAIADAAREVGSDYLQIALFNIAMNAPQANRQDLSKAAADELVEWSERTGQGVAISQARSVAAVSAFFRNEFDAAREHVAVGEAHLVDGFMTPRAGFAMVHANLALVGGDLDEAELRARESLAISEQVGQPDLIDLGYRFLGHIAYRRGDVDLAFEHFDHAAQRMSSRSGSRADAASLGPELALVALERGKPALAVVFVELARRRREDQGLHLPMSWQEIVDDATSRAYDAVTPDELEAAQARAAGLDYGDIEGLIAELRVTS